MIMIKITFIFPFVLKSTCFFMEAYHGRNKTSYVCANMLVRDPDKIETSFFLHPGTESYVLCFLRAGAHLLNLISCMFLH